MKLGSVTLIAGVTLAGAAVAGPMDNVFGNTLMIVEDGAMSHWYINEDGTFTTDQGGSGTWELSGNNLCITLAGAEPSCGPIEERQIGQKWTEDNGKGGTREAMLLEGIVKH